MEYSNFLKVILGEKKASEDVHKAYDLGIDLTEFLNTYHKITSVLFHEIYDDEGCDWCDWFCYDNEYGQRDWSIGDTYAKDENGKSKIKHKDGEVRFGAHDENGNPICYSFESLWEHLETNHKIKND